MIYFDPDARFDCQQCGLCCRTDWTIRLEPPEAERLGLPSSTRQLPKKQTDCTFLRHDNLCSVHTERPLACRAFPFVIRPVPNGWHVGVSHYCPSARNGEGRPLVEHQDEVSNLIEDSQLPQVVRWPVTVWGNTVTGWPGYLLFEAELLERLEDSSLENTLANLVSCVLQKHELWGRLELEDFFTEGPGINRELLEHLGLELANKLGPQNKSGNTYCTGALVRSLIHRKILLTQPSLLEGLAFLCLIPRAIRSLADPDQGVGQLELELSHSDSLSGFARPLIQRGTRE